MGEERVGPDEPERAITRAGRRLVVLWTSGVLLLYVAAGCFGVPALRRYKAEAEALRRDWFALATTEQVAARTGPAPSDGVPEVAVGLYLNRFVQVSVRDSSWSADCDIWFRWSDARIRPGQSFQIVNGEVKQRDRIEARSDSGAQYERYRLKVELTHFFDSTRFPLADELLTIQVEDPTFAGGRARYVADEQASGASPGAAPPQLAIEKSFAMVKRPGSPAGANLPAGSTGDGHSAFVLALLVRPPGWALYAKMFQALFASVAIALIVFFIKPIHADPRFGLSVGAAFTSIANNILVGSYFPMSEHFPLLSMINAVGLLTIFLTLVESAVALYVYDTLGNAPLRVLLDRASFVAFLGGYVTLNVILPCAAAS